MTPAGNYGYPAFLPDGEHILYTWFNRDPQPWGWSRILFPPTAATTRAGAGTDGSWTYIAPDGRLMAVPVTTAPTFAPGAPVPLFDMRLPKGPTAFPYDVAHGGRFLVNSLDAPAADPSGGLTVVLNWAAR